MLRVEQAVGGETEQVAASAPDYGEWDDACRFIPDRNPAVSADEPVPKVFTTLKVNLERHYDDSDARLGSAPRRPARTTIADLPAGEFATDSVLLRHGRRRGECGLLALGDRLMFGPRIRSSLPAARGRSAARWFSGVSSTNRRSPGCGTR